MTTVAATLSPETVAPVFDGTQMNGVCEVGVRRGSAASGTKVFAQTVREALPVTVRCPKKLMTSMTTILVVIFFRHQKREEGHEQ
jgi:hypothetical protein